MTVDSQFYEREETKQTNKFIYNTSYYQYVMKTHEVHASDRPTVPEGGFKKIPRGFNWPDQCQKALEKQLYRAIHLARTNIDYKITHPSECRTNPENKILTECHPEAKKRILDCHEKTLRKAIIPIVDRPKRMNRLG